MVQGHGKPEPKDLWQEPFIPASSWKPCADQRSWEPNGLSLFLCFSLSGVSVGVSVCGAHTFMSFYKEAYIFMQVLIPCI